MPEYENSDGTGMELTKAFIIHLARATQRRDQVDQLIASLPYDSEIMNAVDGKNMQPEDAARYVQHLLKPRVSHALRPAEVATFLSHRKCWQRIVDTNLSAALVLEDDTALPNHTFYNAVELVLEHIRPGDYVRFPTKPRERTKNLIASRGDTNLIEPTVVGLATTGQIVTHEAARKLLSMTAQFDRPVDTYLQLSWHHGVRQLSVWPSGIREVSAELGGSTISQKKSIGEILRREIARPIYRAKVAAYSRLHNWRS